LEIEDKNEDEDDKGRTRLLLVVSTQRARIRFLLDSSSGWGDMMLKRLIDAYFVICNGLVFVIGGLTLLTSILLNALIRSFLGGYGML